MWETIEQLRPVTRYTKKAPHGHFNTWEAPQAPRGIMGGGMPYDLAHQLHFNIPCNLFPVVHEWFPNKISKISLLSKFPPSCVINSAIWIMFVWGVHDPESSNLVRMQATVDRYVVACRMALVQGSLPFSPPASNKLQWSVILDGSIFLQPISFFCL